MFNNASVLIFFHYACGLVFVLFINMEIVSSNSGLPVNMSEYKICLIFFFISKIICFLPGEEKVSRD